jgi:uncharacterized protein
MSFTRTAAAVVGLLLVSSLVSCVTLDMVAMLPTRAMEDTPASYGAAYDEVSLPIAAGRQVSIWHIKAEAQPAKALVVIIPGADRNKSRYLVGVPVFIPYGYDIILMDFEGFGASSGRRPELDRLYDDVRAVIDFARTKNSRVVAYGASLGAPLAVKAAADHDLTAMIVEGPLAFDHEPEAFLRADHINFPLLWEIAGWWIDPQVPDALDIFKYIQDVAEPKLIQQSVDDEIVPFVVGQELFEAAPEPKTFFEMRGRHGQMVEIDPTTYIHTVVGWLDNVIGAQSPNLP